MAVKTVLNYLPKDSIIHRLSGTTKLIFFLMFTFACVITYNTWVLLGLMLVSVTAFKLSKIKLKEIKFMTDFVLIFCLINNIIIFLFDPDQGTKIYETRHVLYHLFWKYDLTAEQLFYHLNFFLKGFVTLPIAIFGETKKFCQYFAAADFDKSQPD